MGALIPPMPTKRQWTAVLHIGTHHMIVTGGWGILPNTNQILRMVADLPVTESTAVSLYDQLLAIGGRDCEFVSTSAVYKYSFVSNLWDVVSHMFTPGIYSICFATVIPDNRALVVGGESGR